MAKKITFNLDFTSNGQKVMGNLAIDSKQLAAAVALVNKQAADFQKKMGDWGFMAQGFDLALGIFQGAESAIQGVAARYNSFDQAMRAANTMAGTSGEDFDRLKESVNSLALEVPVARDVLANGLYQVISNGVPQDNWLSFLEKSARSSVGGMADLGQTVTVTSTILKNYALDWDQAGAIQDKIQLTAKNGVTSFEQLAAALPRVSGNASSLGVNVDELMASFATLTGVSGNTSEVATQLAAIFTSLLKPSSEAAKVAEEMGIQFNAAAIQAAGGFRNFLSGLKESVSAYSAASGELEQAVMAKLFGSAEALRALGPLMGNLSDKFGENIAAMTDSAGTMDAAFNEMAGAAEAEKQAFDNLYSSIMDNVGAASQFMEKWGQRLLIIGETATGVTKLCTLIRNFNIAATIGSARLRVLTLGIRAYGLAIGRADVAQRLINSSMARVAITGTALKVALRGLLVASGVGIAITALGVAIDYFMSNADDATDSANRLNKANKEAESQFQRERGNIELLVGILKNAEEGTDQYRQAKDDLIQQYGQYLTGLVDEEGHIIDLEAAYRRLTQAARESANARALKTATEEAGETFSEKRSKAMNRISGVLDDRLGDSRQRNTLLEIIRRDFDTNGGLSRETEDILGRAFGEERSKMGRWNDSSSVAHIKKYVTELQRASMEYETLMTEAHAKFGTMDNQFKNWEKSQIQAAKLSLEQQIAAGETTDFIVTQNGRQVASYKDVADARLALQKLEEAEKTQSSQSIQSSRSTRSTRSSQSTRSTQSSQSSQSSRSTLSTETAVYRAEAVTLKDITANIRILNEELQTASVERAAEINREIELWNEKADIIRNAGKETLKSAEPAPPAPVSALTTIGELDEALSYWEQRQKEVTADEVENIQKTIEAYRRKRDVIMVGTELPSMMDEASEIESLKELDGKEYEIRITGIGFDELTKRVRGLKRLLGDTENPVTETQRKNIEELITTYTKWGEEGEKTEGTVTDAVSAIGSSISGLGNALELPELNVAGTMAQAIATMVASYAMAMKESTLLGPFGWLAFSATGLAQLTSVVASVKSLPAFADGGIVSGPTVGLIGEYAGASNNPEVVAPLDKLRSLLQPAGQPVIVGGTLRASGRDLVCVLANETRISSKSGRRTNIKI